MKKDLFTQAKKSLSLMMAILMLLSCWVWVAPTEAEAADQNDGYYKVRVAAYVKDNMNATAETWTVSLSDGSSVSLTKKGLSNNIGSSGSPGAITDEAWVKAFPTSLYLKITVDKCSGNGEGRLENCALQVYDFANSTWVDLHGQQQFNCGNGDTSYTFNVDAGKAPAATSIGDVSSKTLTIEIPKITDTSTVKKSSTYESKIYDQYGVWYKQYATLSLKSEDGSLEYKDDTYGFWCTTSGNGVIINTNYKAQQKISGDPSTKTAIAKLYGSHSAVNDAKELVTITLKYPTYKVSVDQKLGATMKFNNGTTQTTAWTSDEVIYGTELSKYPEGTVDEGVNIGATKAGFTFMGYWTVAQPAGGDASYNAESAKFATPVDETTFNTYKGKEDSTVSGSYVTLADGSKYYNAGKKWDSEKDFAVTGDASYHGWWISKDIPVKFYDIDGTYRGTQTAKFGDTPEAGWYPDPKESYDAGAFKYDTFSGKWMDITGKEIEEGKYIFGDLESLTLTPIYTNKKYGEQYTVTFINPANGAAISSTKFDYRYILSGNQIPSPAVLNVLKNDKGMAYEFEGWTTQTPASGSYHAVAVGDTSVAVNTDYVVRNDVTYYAVFRGTVKEYLVSFEYKDTKGDTQTIVQTVAYGSAIKTPNEVNRTYASEGFSYLLEGWDYKLNDKTFMFGVDAALVLNDENVTIINSNLATAETPNPIKLKANYDEGTPAPYNVTFKYKNANGVDVTILDTVDNGKKITQAIVDRVTVPEKYDDGEALYTFAGQWKVTEGNADKEYYTTEEFTSFGPTSHVTFEAVYGEGVPFYTVTYHNGAVTYSERVLKGLNVPAWMIETGELDENGKPIMKEYEPTKTSNTNGEYDFVGWFDAEQTSEDYTETNGTQYTTASIVEGNLDLYAQYKFEPYKFTIKFMNYNATEVLAEVEVEAGKSYESTLKAAEAEAEKRAADETYSYTFIGWDYKVPVNYLCEGKDITYTAQYRPSYIYYEMRWYNDLKSMNNAVPEMEILGQDGLLAITTQTYEGLVYAPTVELTLPEAEAGSVSVFDGWYYVNNGKETKYQRGLKITDGMSFYAKYTSVKNALTFTTVVGDESTEIKVAYGEKVTVGDPADGYVDAANHNDFIGWYKADDTKFDFDTAITENTTIYAKFNVSAHDKAFKELVSAPTYYAAGSEKIWCACDKDKTTETVAIPMLTDTVAPTGTIYLGTQGKWSSTDEIGAAATDNDEVKYFANADTDIILTINDTGDVSDLYNPSGAGKGIQVIQGIISKGVFGAGTTEIAGIQTLFNAETDSEDLNNTENFVIRLGSYEGLEHGQTYIAYYYVKDKAGNVLNTKVRTAKFIYDTEAPEFELEGIGNGKTYCGEVTVTGIEAGATVTVNGTAVEYTGNTYKIVGEGNYIIKVIDRAGNVSAAKKVTVAAGHNTVKTTQAATCVADGYEKVTCIVCDDVISNIIIPSDGHKYSEVTTVVPTCTEGGYDIKVCSVCGDEVKTNVKPATGHTYEKDDNDNIIYTVVTAATCKVAGTKIANCTVCGNGTLTGTIDVDTENGHVYGAVKTLKATCTDPGEKYQHCKLCFKKITEVIPALNHVDTGRYTKETTAATCFSEGVESEFCKACDTATGNTTPIAMKAHTLTLVKYEAENYMQYECQVDGCGHTEGKTAIVVKATYTVTFKGAGENGTDLKLTVTEGESIAADAVADQTKDSTKEYDYTFAGWKGTDGKVVKLPIKVTKNETYTAEFTATKIIYTHLFKSENVDFAKIIGTYNAADKKPMSVPTKKAKEDGTESYTFAGWVKVGETDVATDFTMTENATYEAKFNTVLKNYNVIFYNETDYAYGETVAAGGRVTYVGETPTKAPDGQYHYTFAGWLKDGKVYANGATEITITGIKADTRIYASYAKAAHVYSEVVSFNDATCTESGKKVTKCTCGVEFVEIIPAKGHDHSVALPDNGGTKCSRCDDVLAPTAKKVTLTFKDAYDKLIKSVMVTEGESYTIEAPAKASDAKNDYSFKNWTLNGAVVGTDAKLTVKAGTTDATYVANYNEAIRSYYVTYVNWNYDVLQTVVLEYGATIPAYSKAEPKRDPSKTHHYDFAGWEGYTAGMTVTGPTQFKAQYTAAEHNLSKTVVVDASCTTPYTTYKCCDHDGCEYREAKDTVGSTLAHTPNDAGYIEDVAPGLGTPGKKVFTCSMCGEKITETIPAIPADEIIIIIYNNSGVLATHGSAHVTLYEIVDGEAVIFNTTPVDTDANGRVTFTVEKGKTWRVGITGDDINGGYGGSVKAGTNKFGTAAEEVEKPAEDECSCNCHKNTFWGMIFRFFQKIIKKLTGKAKCCDDPSSKI